MRTKLFFAFFTVIVIALISNLIFEQFVERDFGNYVRGADEDKLYWVLASIEGSFSRGKWDAKELEDSVHWATMLGFEVRVDDTSGKEITTSEDVLGELSPLMRRRMEGIVDIHSAKGKYETYPLYLRGSQIGVLRVRQLSRIGSISEKEATFKRRGMEFLIISFVIAGGSALFLALFFSLFLSKPLNKMKKAVESLAKGDFSVRVAVASKKDEIGRLAESFNFMAEALQREEALRKHLTSNVAHELRTPLSVMKANVEAMIDGVVERQERGLENVRMEVEKLISLVEGIEDLAKAEASFFSGMHYIEVDLQGFLSNVVDKLMPLAKEKGLEMKLGTNLILHVFTDPGKLESIVQNILTNAIRNTERGGIRIDYGASGRMFFVEIADTGAGISGGDTTLIFKRFYRGEGSEGKGLGLAIVKELIDMMGGRIDLKSEVGKGTVFTIWLPLGS
ncbi:MAG: HAMP domain-containing sensor histidine kinase [Candidatus Sulfobium sp.]|jgi:two-component system, OmpR family, sensor histidine kinase BaeS